MAVALRAMPAVATGVEVGAGTVGRLVAVAVTKVAVAERTGVVVTTAGAGGVATAANVGGVAVVVNEAGKDGGRLTVARSDDASAYHNA